MLGRNDTQLPSQGPLKLAIFDIDETFVRGDSFKWFCWFALRESGIEWRELWRLAFDALMHMAGLRDAGFLKMSCLRISLSNVDKATLPTLVDNFIDGVLVKRLHSSAVECLRSHKQQGNTIIFLSASPDLYLNQLGSRFGVDRIICTRFLSQDGQFTGELFSKNCKGGEKRRRLLEIYRVDEIAWDQSYGYGNSAEDIAFLELLGNAVAVNPDAKLKKVAVQRNWAIQAWS
jgi:HAD superfamily hydrolase (TIGR01490 family)